MVKDERITADAELEENKKTRDSSNCRRLAAPRTVRLLNELFAEIHLAVELCSSSTSLNSNDSHPLTPPDIFDPAVELVVLNTRSLHRNWIVLGTRLIQVDRSDNEEFLQSCELTLPNSSFWIGLQSLNLSDDEFASVMKRNMLSPLLAQHCLRQSRLSIEEDVGKLDEKKLDEISTDEIDDVIVQAEESTPKKRKLFLSALGRRLLRAGRKLRLCSGKNRVPLPIDT